MDLSRIPNYDAASYNQRFAGPGTVDGTVYAVPKNWGTTGFAVNTAQLGSAQADDLEGILGSDHG
ncbi:MAG: hypothetical protein R3D63_04165 [Paracoccaceae bacterium]